MLVLYNVRMVLSNVRKKKIKEPPNVTKVQSHVMLVLHNVRMVSSNVRKNKETTECKSIVTCDVSITQCEDGIIECDVLVTKYSKLLTSGCRTPKKKKKKKIGYCRITRNEALALGNANAKCKGYLAFQNPKCVASGNAIAKYCKFFLQYFIVSLSLSITVE